MSTPALTALIARCRLLCRPPSPLSDAALLRRFTDEGDAAAFEELLQRHAVLVWGVCRRILGHEADCEDAFQATFLALVRRAGALEVQPSLAAWLHTVAVRVARKALARSRRQHPQAVVPERTTSGDVADAVGHREILRLVDEEIERLPGAVRAPLILCCLQGRTRDEAAEALGCSVAAIKGRLERGRALLRHRLTQRGVQLPAAFLVLGLTSERIRAGLWAKTLQSVRYTPAPTIAALAEAALLVGKGKLSLALLLLTMSVAGAFGSVLMSKSPHTPDAQPKAKVAAEPKQREAPHERRDRHGDPLPDGAITRLGTVRWRHGFFVQGLAYSPDGKKIAAVGAGRAITLWDSASGKEVHHFPNVSDQPYSLAFSGDGKILATGGWVCRLWEAATGKELRQIGNGGVALSPDGKHLATVGFDGIIHLWTVATGKERWQSEKGLDAIGGLAYSPDGKQIASSGADGEVHLRDADTGKMLHRLKGHGSTVFYMVFSPDSKYLASSSGDESIRLWDAATGRLVRVLGEKLGSYSSLPLAFSPDGRQLASGHGSGIIRLWDVRTGEQKRRWQAGAMRVQAIAFAPDGKTLASGAAWESIRLWDVATGQERNPSEGHRGFVEGARFSSFGGRLVSISRDRGVIWWDLSTRKPLRQFSYTAKGFSPFALSPDGNTLATADWLRNELRLWDTRTGKPSRLLDTAKKRITALAFSPDGRLVASGVQEDGIHVWDVRSGKEVRQIPDVAGDQMSLCFSPDSKSLARAVWMRGQRTLRLWDMDSGEEKVKLACFDTFVGPVVFSPDGKIVAAGCNDTNASGPSSVRLWDTASGKELKAHTGHGDPVGAIAFSPDGKLAASGAAGAGYRDNSLHVWEAATGQLIRRFEGHHSCIGSVDFSPDGLMVASGAGDSTVLLWDITGRRGDGRWHAKPLTPPQLGACWAALADEDTAKAYDAVWALVAAPEQALPFLRKHLPPVPRPDAKIVARPIADLDSDDFRKRENATEELSKLGDVAAPALRQALEGKPSLEMRRRLQQLLDQTRDWTGERLRAHRAIQALEHIGMPQAKDVLQALAGGAPDAERTEAAKAALQRLAR